MKHLIRRRFLPVFLCMALAMSLTACGGKDTPPVEMETGGAAGTLSGRARREPFPAVRERRILG